MSHLTGSKVVVVESPAKAKTINRYLGDDFVVLPSYGHVRDLPEKDGSVQPESDFSMDWELGERSVRHMEAIAKAVKSCGGLVLATDPDREGEAIAWHVHQVLDARHLLDRLPVERVTFNEITRQAVLTAMAQPRKIDQELVDAYLARRALDYLYGFTLSPLLWRKLPGAKAAGRVQSVALRLVCEREAEIDAFRAREYWTVDVRLQTGDGANFTARLVQLDGQRVDRHQLGDKRAADDAVARILPARLSVGEIERKQVRRNPAPPFTTSTLQQEASRKLGFGTMHTMRVAQKLYEGIDIGGETVGLITYMRTDGVQMAAEAVSAIRQAVTSDIGAAWLPDAPRTYRSKAKNAQEAHEAIRPTDVCRRPVDLARILPADEFRLYELIWKRAVASQMASAVFDQMSVTVRSVDGAIGLRATGSVMTFDGFLRVYQEDRDDPVAENEDEESSQGIRLPPVKTGDPLGQDTVTPRQHFTQPPPRYTEASLVKKLEELGIGRPSTYASTVQRLGDHRYIANEKRRLQPTDVGRVVIAFLTSFFERYVQYDFTANLEEQLDDISGGHTAWKEVLRRFWNDFAKSEGDRLLPIRDAVGQLDEKIGSRRAVLDVIDAMLGPHFFPKQPDGTDGRACPACAAGRLSLKLGKIGPFIGCGSYPDCRYTRPLAVMGKADGEMAGDLAQPKTLGDDPKTGLPVTLRRGPYGVFVQLGPAADAPPGEKPKRASLPPRVEVADIDLELALRILALPREVGTHPDTKDMIVAGVGRYGPYLHYGGKYKTLPADEDVLTIGINRAVDILASATTRGRAEASPARVIGPHPSDAQPVTLHSGRYGPYVRHGRVMASLTKGMDADSLDLPQALALIEAKAARAPAAAPRGRASTAKSRASMPTTASGTDKKTETPKRRVSSKAAEATTAKTGTADVATIGKRSATKVASGTTTRATPGRKKKAIPQSKSDDAAPATKPGGKGRG